MKIFCGIDPGREKFGLALVADMKLLLSAVIPLAEAEAAIDALNARCFQAFLRGAVELDPAALAEATASCSELCVYVGDGTGSEVVLALLRAKEMTGLLVDERNSTLEGRGRYWLLHPPRGLWRLIPVSLRVPPRPVDDLAAWVIAERGMAGQRR